VTLAALAEPPATTSDVSTTLVLVVFAALAAGAFAYAVYAAIRRRDILPVAACIGALICALNEPIYDLLGKIVYASDHTIAYSAFDRDIPLFLVVGYLPWVGLLPYLISRMMRAGVARSRLHAIALASFASVVVVETLGTSLDAWTYYGEPPLKYLGVAPMMAPVPILCGFLLYAFGDVVHGWKRAFAFVIPTLALPAVYASAGWPMYLALYSDVPKSVQWLAGAATLALCALVVVAVTAAAERWRSAEIAQQSAGGVLAGQPGHPAAGVGAGTAQVEAGNGGAVAAGAERRA
jgi:hypothetical protein